jgi:hypothetical protein
MKKNLKALSQKLTYWLGVVAIGLLVGLSLQFVRAWTEPPVAAPGGNVGAPINASATAQTKWGPLALPSLAIYGGGSALQANSGTISTQDVWLTSVGKWASSLGAGTLAGGGTASYIPKWTSPTTLGNSIITDNGTNGLFITGGSGGAIFAVSSGASNAIFGINNTGTGAGVSGWSVGGNGVYGRGVTGVYGSGTSWAGYFEGPVRTTTLTFGDGTVQTTAAGAAPPPAGINIESGVDIVTDAAAGKTLCPRPGVVVSSAVASAAADEDQVAGGYSIRNGNALVKSLNNPTGCFTIKLNRSDTDAGDFRTGIFNWTASYGTGTGGGPSDCSCPGSNASDLSGSSICWTSYSGGNANYPHCGQICTPAGWRLMAPCGSYY